MSFQGNIFSFMPVFTYEHILLLIFLAFFRPLCVCVCLGKRKMEGGRERGCTHARTRACVWTQPSPNNLITKIRRLKKEKADFNLEQI